MTLRANWTAASRFGSLAWPFRARMISLAGSLAICSAVKLLSVRQQLQPFTSETARPMLSRVFTSSALLMAPSRVAHALNAIGRSAKVAGRFGEFGEESCRERVCENV